MFKPSIVSPLSRFARMKKTPHEFPVIPSLICRCCTVEVFMMIKNLSLSVFKGAVCSSRR
jgi:hypothetical protein